MKPGALSDVGRYAIVPEWLLDTDVSARAIRLYAVVAAKYADRRHIAWPTRRSLAAELHASVDTVDRAVKELVRVGALEVERRVSEEGDPTSNLYRLFFSNPDAPMKRRSRKTAARGHRRSAAQNQTHSKPDPSPNGDGRPRPGMEYVTAIYGEWARFSVERRAKAALALDLKAAVELEKNGWSLEEVVEAAKAMRTDPWYSGARGSNGQRGRGIGFSVVKLAQGIENLVGQKDAPAEMSETTHERQMRGDMAQILEDRAEDRKRASEKTRDKVREEVRGRIARAGAGAVREDDDGQS